jgi:hypothetical protein
MRQFRNTAMVLALNLGCLRALGTVIGVHNQPRPKRGSDRGRHRFMVPRLLILAAAAAGAFAQNLSLGVIGGANLTRGIQSTATPIAGPMLQWNLPHNFSLEFDGLWHSYPAGPQLGTDVTWEFPMLARYTFPLPIAKPFVEAGPALRIGAPTVSGLSAGAGIDFRVLHHLDIAPMLRYTHWAASASSNLGGWNPNQSELLTAISWTAEENFRPLGPYVSLGLVLGSTLTADFRGVSQTGVVTYDNLAPFTATSVSVGESSFRIGPSFEIQLPLGLALEVDALRCPLSELNYWTVPNGTVLSPAESAALNALNAAFQGPHDVTWDFPLLVKYTFQLSRAEPLVEMGPSFRLPQEVNGGQLSTHGVTAAAGFEVHLLRLRVAPEVRFTRWASDHPAGSTRFNPNQVEFLTSFAF